MQAGPLLRSRPKGGLVRIIAAILLIYGTALIFLQTEALLKMLRGAMGYGAWVWGGLSNAPIAWGAPTGLDDPLRSVYAALTLRQPLLPWVAWVAGSIMLLLSGQASSPLAGVR